MRRLYAQCQACGARKARTIARRCVSCGNRRRAQTLRLRRYRPLVIRTGEIVAQLQRMLGGVSPRSRPVLERHVTQLEVELRALADAWTLAWLNEAPDDRRRVTRRAMGAP